MEIEIFLSPNRRGLCFIKINKIKESAIFVIEVLILKVLNQGDIIKEQLLDMEEKVIFQVKSELIQEWVIIVCRVFGIVID